MVQRRRIDPIEAVLAEREEDGRVGRDAVSTSTYLVGCATLCASALLLFASLLTPSIFVRTCSNNLRKPPYPCSLFHLSLLSPSPVPAIKPDSLFLFTAPVRLAHSVEHVIRTHFRLKSRVISAQLDEWLEMDDGFATSGPNAGTSLPGPNKLSEFTLSISGTALFRTRRSDAGNADGVSLWSDLVDVEEHVVTMKELLGRLERGEAIDA